MKRIEPRTIPGFRDRLPNEMIAKEKLIATVEAVYRSFGYLPLDTPAMEYEDVLTGAEESFSGQIFRIVSRSSGRIINRELLKEGTLLPQESALRFDLTVPLCRVFAQHYESLVRPFKRYHYGKVWRAETPQIDQGRYCEFEQFDFDIVGSDDMMADAEVMAVMVTALQSFGLERFRVNVNNRKLLDGIAQILGFAGEDQPVVLRVIDKLPKVGMQKVLKELEKGEGEDKIGFNKITGKALDQIRQFLEIKGEPDQVLEELRSRYGQSARAEEALDELTLIVQYLRGMDINQRNWSVDPTVIRGLGYYSGPVFETILEDLPEFGSPYSGGRFDALVSRFSSMKAPAVGASIGVDRFLDAMIRLEKIEVDRKTYTQVLIINFDPNLASKYLSIASLLRQSGINTEVYFGEERGFKAQLNYAIKLGIPLVIILGEKEAAKNQLAVKDLRSRQQTTIEESQLLTHVKTVL